jgi:phage host-nuclease inhibitor protein Gam
MGKRVKGPAIAVPVPQSRDAVNAAIASIGELQRSREALETAMNAELAKTKLAFEAEAKSLGEKIASLRQGIEIWCSANRDELTDSGKTKTVVLAAGEVRWRMTPPAVSLKNVAEVVKRLAKGRLRRFLRVKIEIDKEAILKEPDAVKGIEGITIGQHEEFVVVPFETKLEEVA